MSTWNIARCCTAAAVFVSCLNAPARADDDLPSVTPYRPSVSTPAALSAPGWLELEAGAQHDHGGAARRSSLPYTLKLAFSPDWGVRVGGEAWVRQSDDSGRRFSGAGDTSVVLKRRFEVDDSSAFGLEAGATLPTGRDGISAGRAAYAVNGIYSADLGSYHTDLNLSPTRLGSAEAGASRTKWLWAASLSAPFSARWGWVAEFSGTTQNGTGPQSQFLAAASYNLSPTVTLDAGLARQLRAGEPQWSFFSGLTVLAGKLF